MPCNILQYNRVVNQMADVEKAQEGTGPGVYAAARFCPLGFYTRT
jgi:hypothetical protein